MAETIDWTRIHALCATGKRIARDTVAANSQHIRERYQLPDGRYLDLRFQPSETKTLYINYAIRNYQAHCWVV